MKPKIESDILLSIAMDVVWQNGGQTKTTLDKIPRELR